MGVVVFRHSVICVLLSSLRLFLVSIVDVVIVSATLVVVGAFVVVADAVHDNIIPGVHSY